MKPKLFGRGVLCAVSLALVTACSDASFTSEQSERVSRVYSELEVPDRVDVIKNLRNAGFIKGGLDIQWTPELEAAMAEAFDILQWEVDDTALETDADAARLFDIAGSVEGREILAEWNEGEQDDWQLAEVPPDIAAGKPAKGCEIFLGTYRRHGETVELSFFADRTMGGIQIKWDGLIDRPARLNGLEIGTVGIPIMPEVSDRDTFMPTLTGFHGAGHMFVPALSRANFIKVDIDYVGYEETFHFDGPHFRKAAAAMKGCGQ